jgi:hypothetical protein
MTKKRTNIPNKTRDAVMREYNHLCAICGTQNPQIHHIDEDPANNAIENLLPLCPNCHHLDHHNPTSPTDSRKLQLFRDYKDPLILSPQFDPLFRRCEFLLSLDKSHFGVNIAKNKADELIQFISELEMGSFYADAIGRCIEKPSHSGPFRPMDGYDPGFRQQEEKHRAEYFDKLNKAAVPVLKLVAELLPYQTWIWEPKSN